MDRTVLIFLLCLALAGCAKYTAKYTTVPETGSTLSTWSIARGYQAQGRFEMARQYFVLALANARTPDSQTALRQEIEAVERQIQAMR
ncbi:MAG: hypothetical protein LBC10_05215 [Deltaproteobacteria bacterium]|jgi:hypothetical protein|nr:hypothetical protein [Deltaproteobacteria bacterium]